MSSIDDLRKRKVAPWDGVRNYQARNFMRAMQQGDQAFFYHSSTNPPSVVGVMEIAREACPDPTQFDPKSDHYDAGSKRESPRWDQVEVKFLRRLCREVTLAELRRTATLKAMSLFTRPRLSVHPITESQWKSILKISDGDF